VVTGGSVTIRIAGSTGAYFELQRQRIQRDRRVGLARVNADERLVEHRHVSPATAGSITTSDDSLFVGAVATDYGGTNLAPVAGNSFTLIGSSTNGSFHQTGAERSKDRHRRLDGQPVCLARDDEPERLVRVSRRVQGRLGQTASSAARRSRSDLPSDHQPR
jgi:hypothetical protein